MTDFIVGCGQGGSRIAKRLSEVFEVESAFLNLTSIDFSKMFDKDMKNHTFVLEEGGTGRDPKSGEKKVKRKMTDLKEFLTGFESFEDAESVAIVVGGGGGSGSGFAFPLIDWLANRKNVFVIFTLPENREGLPVKPNAYIAFDRLLRHHCSRDSEKPISLLILDNEYGIQTYGRGNDSYWSDLNDGLVNAFRRFSNLIREEYRENYLDMAAGYKALDENDLKSVLFAKGGMVDIRELAFSDLNVEKLSKSIRNSSLVFGGLDTRTAKRYLVAIGIPSKWKGDKEVADFVEAIFEAIAKQSKHTPYVIRSTHFNPQLEKIRVHILMSGLTESKQSVKMKRSIVKDMDKMRAKEDSEGLDIEGLEEFV